MCLIFIGLILIGTDLIGFIPQWSKGTIYAHGGQCSGLKESFLFLEIVYFLFLGGSEAAMGGGGARSAPFGGGNELKKTGAHSARACTRGQNPLVFIIYLSRILCLSSCHPVILSYSCLSLLRNAELFFLF
jgi:hypothetical protein